MTRKHGSPCGGIWVELKARGASARSLYGNNMKLLRIIPAANLKLKGVSSERV